MPIPIYFINLASRPDRRRFMEEQFDSLGLQAERIEAVTPDDISQSDLETYCDSRNRQWMPPKALSCNLSHERAWQRMLEDGHGSALILEDDAILSRSLPEFLAALDGATAPYSLIRIETKINPVGVLPVDTMLTETIALRRCRSTNSGAAGYVIRADLAQELIGSVEMRVLLIDGLLYHPFIPIARKLDVGYTDPALCIQLELSDRHAEPTAASNLRGPRDKGIYARKHPIRRFGRKVLSWFTIDARSAWDHFYWSRRGLEMKVIPFRPD